MRMLDGGGIWGTVGQRNLAETHRGAIANICGTYSRHEFYQL